MTLRTGTLRFNLLALVILLSGCLPASAQIPPTLTSQPATVEATDAPTEDLPTEESATDALTLQDAPIIPEVPLHMREVYLQGIANGRNPAIFTKVGDCMSASPDYLFPFAAGEYDLGDYRQLQAVIDHFGAETIREVDGQPVNSFSNPSLAVSCGFNSAGPIDPLWADPDYCESGESSLTCELRVSNAAFVLIMLGTHDLHFPRERFKGYLEQMVQEAIDTGVVPILVTFPPRSDDLENAELYNGVVVEVAQEQQIPLANLWRVLHGRPNYGVQPDHPTALSLPADGCATCFTAENLQSGATVQNWVSLLALYEVWTSVAPEEAFRPTATVTPTATRQPPTATITATRTPRPTATVGETVEPTVTTTPATELTATEESATETPTPAAQPSGYTGHFANVGSNLQSIYQLGQQLGNNPNAFSKIGDCEAAFPVFLQSFDTASYDLGNYQYLAGVLSRFRGSFGRVGEAADGGMSSMALLNTLWADPNVCQPGETPLACEYRLQRPSVALIMVRTLDQTAIANGQFHSELTQIVRYSLDQGIIPIMSTIPYWGPSNPDSTVINDHIRSVAYENNVPLWDFWVTSEQLPNRGVTQDYHIADPSYPRAAYFDAESLQMAVTRRNLEALEIMHAVLTQLNQLP